MAVTLNPKSGAMEIIVDGPLTIMEAADARDQFALGLVTASGDVEINLSRVSEIDSAGLQLLMCLTREPKAPHFTQIGAPVMRVLRYLGLDERFGLKEEDHGI